jgi:aspartate racemase
MEQGRGSDHGSTTGVHDSFRKARNLEKQGIAYASISQTLAGRLNQAIFKCQAGQEDATDRAITHEAILALRNQGVDGIILGCTEIPLLLQGEDDLYDLLNPAQVLAEAAVRYALG